MDAKVMIVNHKPIFVTYGNMGLLWYNNRRGSNYKGPKRYRSMTERMEKKYGVFGKCSLDDLWGTY